MTRERSAAPLALSMLLGARVALASPALLERIRQVMTAHVAIRGRAEL